MRARFAHLLMLALFAGACGPADGVKIQPLPPLTAPSLESRVGLPTVRGTWHFAGWELASGDTAGVASGLPGLGAIQIQSQTRDSLAGSYQVEGSSAPLIGELRRDSVVALVVYLAPDDARFVTGRLWRDTLWVDLASLVPPGVWRTGARAAFLTGPVASPSVWVRGAPRFQPAPDSEAAAPTGGVPTGVVPTGVVPTAPDTAVGRVGAPPANRSPQLVPTPPSPSGGEAPSGQVGGADTTRLPPAGEAQTGADTVSRPPPIMPEPEISVPAPEIPLLGVPIDTG